MTFEVIFMRLFSFVYSDFVCVRRYYDYKKLLLL